MRSENSGLIDLDALMKEAASSGELPPSPDDSLRAVSTPDPPRPLTPLPSPSRSPSRSPSPSHPPPPSPRKRSLAPFVALVSALGAVALIAFVALRSPAAPPPSTATLAPPPIASPVVTSPPAMGEPPSAHGISLADLPAPQASAAPVIPIATASAKIVPLPDAPPAASNDLGGAMRDAVGPLASASAIAPEEASGGAARQLKPSPGAVIGAINAVLPAARACLDEDDPPRNATIIFASDGKVARVDIAGPERTKDECIKGAFMKARTMPFVEDSFAARATVRP